MKNQIQFNNIILDLVTRQIFISGQKVQVQKKSFDLLQYLIDNRERAISKDELLDKLWDRDYASENVLAHATSKLRTALNDNKKPGQIIRTVHGFGLQFVGDINETYESTTPFNVLKWTIVALALLSFFVVGLYVVNLQGNDNSRANEIQLVKSQQPKLTVINESIESRNWEVNGMTAYLNQLMSYSDNILPINIIQNDEANMNDNKLLAVDNIIVAKQEYNILYLTYKENDIIRSQFEVTIDDLSTAVAKVNTWICQDTLIENKHCQRNAEKLTPDDTFIIENYIRGQNAIKNQRTKEAINFFEICLQQDENFILSRIALAQAQYRISNYNSAIAQALTVINTTKNPLLMTQSKLILGKSYYRISEHEKAKDLFNQIIAKPQGNQIPMGLALLEMTKIDKDNLTLDVAIKNAEKAKNIFQDLKLPGKVAQSKEMIGDIYLTKGELKSAQDELTQSLKIYESVNNIIGVHNVSASLGTVQRRLGNYMAAHEYAKQRLDMAKKIDDPISIIGAHSQMAYSLIELGKLEKALTHANKMTQMALQENEINTLYFAYALEAEIANSMNNFTLAMDKNRQALTIAKDLKQAKKQIETLCFMGDLATNATLYDEADQYLEECLQLSITHDYLLFKAVSQLYLATLHSKMNDKPKAIAFLEHSLNHAKELKHDKLFNEIYMEFFYIYKSSSTQMAEMYLEKIPESYKNNHPYLIANAEIYFKKNQYKKALEVALEAKQVASEMWLPENQILLDQILVKVNKQ